MAQNAFDMMAEQALLGAAILAHEQSLPAFLMVPEKAYYQPKHQVLSGVIRDMVVRRQPVDQITLLSAITEAGLIMRVGGAPYLHTLVSRPYMAVNAQAYAERILDTYGRRRMWEELNREMQRLDADWESGECGRPIDASVGSIRAICDELMQWAPGAVTEPPRTLSEFLAERDTYNWLVPNLLERGDRLIVTGEEGFGKSELTSQLALSFAGSVHPWTGAPMHDAQLRVLIVDCENRSGQSRRRWRRIGGAVDSCRAMHQADQIDWEKRLHLEIRPSGLDLLSGADVAYLESMVASVSPDLLVLGPLYKLHNTNINDGTAAREMLSVLDRLQERHQFALITEAHASKGTDARGTRTLEPEGSGLFTRWPEFGFGLRRSKDDPMNQADVVSWRGQREERDWPSTLHRRCTGLLPWGPDASYYDRVMDRPDDSELSIG